MASASPITATAPRAGAACVCAVPRLLHLLQDVLEGQVLALLLQPPAVVLPDCRALLPLLPPVGRQVVRADGGGRGRRRLSFDFRLFVPIPTGAAALDERGTRQHAALDTRTVAAAPTPAGGVKLASAGGARW